MTWVLVGAAWLAVGLALALVVAGSVRIADARSALETSDAPNFVIDPATGGPALAVPAGGDPPTGRSPSLPFDPPTVPGIPAARPSADRRPWREQPPVRLVRRSKSA